MCDLMASVDRMTDKLCKARDIADEAIASADTSGRVGQRYMILSNGIAQVANLVKDTMAMRNYWYMKFSEEGLLKGSGDEKKITTDYTDCHGLNPCESVKSVVKKEGGAK